MNTEDLVPNVIHNYAWCIILHLETKCLPGLSERERALKGSGTLSNADPASKPRMSADLSA